MTRYGIGRCRHTGRMGWSRTSTRVAYWLMAGAMIVALSPSTSHAQFGRLKKLKEKFSAPDSAARAKDSLEQIAAGVKPESVKVGKSFLQKTGSVVSTANGALESATGISAKDAALAATGSAQATCGEEARSRSDEHRLAGARQREDERAAASDAEGQRRRSGGPGMSGMAGAGNGRRADAGDAARRDVQRHVGKRQSCCDGERRWRHRPSAAGLHAGRHRRAPRLPAGDDRSSRWRPARATRRRRRGCEAWETLALKLPAGGAATQRSRPAVGTWRPCRSFSGCSST